MSHASVGMHSAPDRMPEGIDASVSEHSVLCVHTERVTEA